MLRRDFIKIVGGSAVCLPLATRGQQSQKWRVGFLHPGSGQSVAAASRIAAFRSGLTPAGVGAPVEAEVVARFASDQLDRLPVLAADLVEQGVQSICAAALPAVRAARQVTHSVPIIALDLESDPIANGWATSLGHPGGNVTGIFLDVPDFSAKTLSCLER